MAKFYGAIGFVNTVDVGDGIWEDSVVEKMYYGDVNYVRRQLNYSEPSGKISLNNEISIVADAFLNENLFSIRYVVFKNAKWTISNVEVSYPRMKLTIGGLYEK